MYVRPPPVPLATARAPDPCPARRSSDLRRDELISRQNATPPAPEVNISHTRHTENRQRVGSRTFAAQMWAKRERRTAGARTGRARGAGRGNGGRAGAGAQKGPSGKSARALELRPQKWSQQLARDGAVGVVLGALIGNPGEELAQLAAGGLDGVLLALGAQFPELGGARVLVLDEAVRERTVLHVGQHGLHVFLHRRIDDARARDVVAVLGGVGNGPALLGDAAFEDQVDDELELMQDLEVGNLGLVASLGQHLKAVLNHLRYATAQHSLLTAQVRSD